MADVSEDDWAKTLVDRALRIKELELQVSDLKDRCAAYERQENKLRSEIDELEGDKSSLERELEDAEDTAATCAETAIDDLATCLKMLLDRGVRFVDIRPNLTSAGVTVLDTLDLTYPVISAFGVEK